MARLRSDKCVMVWALKAALYTSASYQRTYKAMLMQTFCLKYCYLKQAGVFSDQTTILSLRFSLFPVLLYLTNASRNTFLAPVITASISGTCLSINSLYVLPFPSFFGAFDALKISITSRI